MIEETNLTEDTVSEDTAPERSAVSEDASYQAAPPCIESPTDSAPSDPIAETPAVDYARLAEEDLAALQEEFPALARIRSIAELPNCTRYGALRDLGLSPKEAYLAIGGVKGARQDNRAHLRSSIPRPRTGSTTTMSSAELQSARMLFGNLSDAEIARLYQKVRA